MAMTSRLYTAAYSSSDDESSDEISGKAPVKRFMRPVQSDSEDEKRVVRSAKDKRHEEIQSILRNLNNHKKIKDMSKVETDFDELVKVYEKAHKMNEVDVYPKFYIRVLAQLEDFVNESWSQKKALSKVGAKSLTVLKQKIRKYNKDFEEQIKKYRENPELYEEEAEEEIEEGEESVEEEEVIIKPVVAPVSKGSDESSDEDDEDDDDYFRTSDESESSDSGPEIDMEHPYTYFLKVEGKPKKEETKKKAPKPKPVKQVVKPSSEESGDEWRVVAPGDGSALEPTVQAFEKGVEITQELVFKKVTEIIANRGKRTSSIAEQICLLDQVCQKAEELHLGVGINVKAILSLITVLFDYESRHPAFMPVAKFQRTIEQLKKLFEILKNNLKDLEISESITEETESVLERPYRIRGSILGCVGRLDDEYFKILQNANGHEMEYDERLRDEPRVCELIDLLIEYLERIKAPPEALCVAYLRKVEHLYYKFDFEWGKKAESEGLEAAGLNPYYEVVERLCHYIYKNDKTDRLRTRAILCHIYFLALFDHWYKARDLMLMSNLQATIDHADHSTMILYNRAMVQMGLCAFRQGHIKDAHSALSDLTGSSKIRELLAQGQRYERTPEEEKREKALQMPYHMHINTELIETVFLICAMLQEVPILAASQDDTRARFFSKAFSTVLRIQDRATLIGPPESPRDHVIAASKAMRFGNWRNATKYIFSPKMDAKIWVLFYDPSSVKKMLEEKIKEECLRCYLFTYSSVHESVSLSRLAEHFEFPRSQIYSIISKMIINQELAASLEVPADFLTMHKGERSRLQNLAIQLADKVNSIMEMNEKLIDNRGGMISGPKGSYFILQSILTTL
ncbi:Eukaryotic translation initiation factor 3 subunit C [Taenia solium]|eukprot:TsM_000103000 transcript=TsM_000103000 gene=TsM_000103000